ncbi:MAG: hypothetical protein IJG17_02555 [Eubacterium sp.]|nr:hypothetical protein [Eubacterium sp.]MBQ6362486.1 hypothetical protein [Lachnospiraceae bacterium]
MHRSYEEIRETVHERILSGIDYSVELADEEILRLIDEETMRCAEEEQLTLSQMRTLRQEVFYSIRKLDVLQELVDDPGITEIMINGTENIFIERNGKTTRYARRFTSRQKLEDVIQLIFCNPSRLSCSGLFPQKPLIFTAFIMKSIAHKRLFSHEFCYKIQRRLHVLTI